MANYNSKWDLISGLIGIDTICYRRIKKLEISLAAFASIRKCGVVFQLGFKEEVSLKKWWATRWVKEGR